MTILPQALAGPATLGSSAATIFTGPTGLLTVIKNATFTNYSASAVSFTLYVLRSGGSTGNAALLISAQQISAGAAYVSQELQNLVLGPGDLLSAQASAGSAINYTISGYTLTTSGT